MNPAARELSLTPSDLEALPAPSPGEYSVWLRRRFYHVTIAAAGKNFTYVLQPDTFMATAGESLAYQLREKVSTAFLSMHLIIKSPAEDPADTEEHLQELNRTLYQLLRMTEQLELAATPKSAFCPLGLTDLTEFLTRFCADMSDVMDALHIKFTLDVKSQAPLHIQGNDEMLRYLFMNLISNAVKALPDKGGKVSISLKELHGQGVITVSDNGSGIPPDVLTVPLWNQPNYLSVDRGLGLGLLLADRIVSAHNGTLVLNRTERGSQVNVSFPIEPDKLLLQSPGAALERNAGFSKKHIALADILPAEMFPPYTEEE